MEDKPTHGDDIPAPFNGFVWAVCGSKCGDLLSFNVVLLFMIITVLIELCPCENCDLQSRVEPDRGI